MSEEDKLPPGLARLRGRGDGYVTPPPDYFRDLAGRATRRPRIRRLRYGWLVAAAAAVLLLLVGYAGHRGAAAGPPNSADLLRDVSGEDIEAYLVQYADELEPEDIWVPQTSEDDE